MTQTRATTVNSRPGPLARLKLTEPVRLYLYSVGGVVVAGLVLAGYLTGDWAAYLTSALATVLGVGAGAEAARASVFCLATHAQDLLKAGRAGRASAHVDLAAGQ